MTQSYSKDFTRTCIDENNTTSLDRNSLEITLDTDFLWPESENNGSA
jgi:hypothetical protein